MSVSLSSFIKSRLLQIVDALIDSRPQPVPSISRLDRCRIIAHRGDHRGNPLEENSMAAFRRAEMAGIWGVELDIRFTADLEPVVCHDPDLSRIFSRPQQIAELSLSELKDEFPTIPTLADVVQTFGHKLHLMIEIKSQPWPNPHRQNRRLQQILAELAPSKDFHLLCLHPRALEPLEGFPSYARLAISEYGPELRSRWIRRSRWGGLCGHYLLLRGAIIRSLHQNGQKVGTGYIRSRNCLFREINRGIDWIFSNHAGMLQQIVNACLTDRQ
ncbi:MAG: glycerophosphodiester phosphodiesterase [Desulfobacteraceae bacterium]|jgi:glycerophosphoryl diester phosphodiesterase